MQSSPASPLATGFNCSSNINAVALAVHDQFGKTGFCQLKGLCLNSFIGSACVQDSLFDRLSNIAPTIDRQNVNLRADLRCQADCLFNRKPRVCATPPDFRIRQ